MNAESFLSEIKSLTTKAIKEECITASEYLSGVSRIFSELSDVEKKELALLVESQIKMSSRDILMKHSGNVGEVPLVRELEFQVLLVLHIRSLVSTCEETSADHELSDWVYDFVARLSLCTPSQQQWKQFLRLEIVDRFGKCFGRTLYHVYLNLGLEPPDCLPDDDTDHTTSLSFVSENVLDEVDGPLISIEKHDSPSVSRSSLRQTLPRALFSDSYVISRHENSYNETPKALSNKSTPSTMFGRVTRSTGQAPTPKLVLISCQRSKRKRKTPTKRVTGKPEPRKRLTNLSAQSSVNSSKQTCSTDRLSQRKRPSSNRTSKKDSTSGRSKKSRYSRSVHETPNPHKSCPRWERAKLAAAAKTKNRAIIVDESPIKPLGVMNSPLRRLRRANSMLNNGSMYLNSQVTAAESNLSNCLLDRSSNLVPPIEFAANSSNESHSKSVINLSGFSNVSCVSVTMSRAVRWCRRQIEEELSLSQYTCGVRTGDTVDTGYVQSDNHFDSTESCQAVYPNYLTRRNSNLFANITSPDADSHCRQSAIPSMEVSNSINVKVSNDEIKTPDKCLVSVPTDYVNAPIKSNSFLFREQNNESPVGSTTPVQLNLNSSKKLSTPRSTPRRRTALSTLKSTNNNALNATFHSGPGLSRARHSSGVVSNSFGVSVSPQIFDEEAMFLGREEFLHQTTPSLLHSTSSDYGDGTSEVGSPIPIIKRKKILEPPLLKLSSSCLSSDNIIPLDAVNTKFNGQTGNRSGRRVVEPILYSSSNCAKTKTDDIISHCLHKPERSPFAPLHLFNCSSINPNDPLDNMVTLSDQSASACVNLRKQLFGSESFDELKTQSNLSHSKNSDSRVSEVCAQQAADNSHHPWDESSVDLSLSPALYGLKRSMRRTGSARCSPVVQVADLNTNLIPSATRLRRSLFR